jgi:hypothetical protein
MAWVSANGISEAAHRTYGAKRIGAMVSLIFGLTRSYAGPRRLPHEAVILANANFLPGSIR